MDQQSKLDIDQNIKKSETEIIKIVDEMYWSGGISTPVKTISDLLNGFFTTSETDLKDNSISYFFQNAEPLFVQNTVFHSLELIQFCASLLEEYAKLDNLKRQKAV